MIAFRRIPIRLCLGLTAVTFLAVAQQQMPKSSTEKIPGAPQVATQTLQGTVIVVEGNQLVVRTSEGEIRTFNVPESRRFIVDGQELTVHELKPGTTLTATVTTTTTPITERTTTIGTGKVWYVAGNTVIITLPNNENRMYKVQDAYRFTVDGQPASVHELRKGMVISASKIVESPATEIAVDTTVTGHAPPAPKPVVAETPKPSPVPERPRPAPARAAEPAPAPPAEVAEAPAPTALPKTGSPVPLMGLAGMLFTAAGLVVRRLRSRS